MKAYTTTEFRAHLATALQIAKQQGVVKIYNNKGDEFFITPSQKKGSPFENVSTIKIPQLSHDAIIMAIRESREQS